MHPGNHSSDKNKEQCEHPEGFLVQCPHPPPIPNVKITAILTAVHHELILMFLCSHHWDHIACVNITSIRIVHTLRSNSCITFYYV